MQQQPQRIQAVDALRGFAVMGIILLHNIEHFNFYSFPDAPSATLRALDSTIWEALFFTFSGKAYAIFALLFGFTFYLQDEGARRRGRQFGGRYLWRLLLLLGFGFVNALFFPGEILVLYALLGVFLLPVRRISDKALAWLVLLMMAQPVEWMKVIYALFCPQAELRQTFFSLGDVYPQLGGHSFCEMIKANFVTGQLASLNWAWCYGRVFQTVGLFYLGLLMGRRGLFLGGDAAVRFWQRLVFTALPVTLVLYFAKSFVFTQVESPLMLQSLRTILNSWYNLGFMLVMAGGFLLLYWATDGNRLQRLLAPYGRMSLTDYVSQSVIGSWLYFGYGLELHRLCGTTYSFAIGLLFLAMQLTFAHWWFRHFRRGPLEALWHRLTWMES